MVDERPYNFLKNRNIFLCKNLFILLSKGFLKVRKCVKVKRDKRGDRTMGDIITLKGIQQGFFRVQMILIISLALFLGIGGTLINIHFERQKRDQNL